MKWFKRILSGIIILVVLLILAGFVYEQISRYRARSLYKPTGKLVDIGGYKLHVDIRGSGKPVVVFESGLDQGGFLAWSAVQDSVAGFTTAVSYDRAGILFSERGNKPRSGAAMAEELHTLLQNAGLKGPYVLVGHSMAGIILRSFIHKYPGEVAGVVFVDTSHPEQFTRYPDFAAAAADIPADWVLQFAAATGLVRLGAYDVYPTTQPEDLSNKIKNAFFPTSLPAVLEEKNQFDAIGQEAIAAGNFGDIPLTIITGTSKKRLNDFADPEISKKFIPVWLGLQKEQLSLSTRSKHVLATESSHYVQFDEPSLVIEAIRELTKP